MWRYALDKILIFLGMGGGLEGRSMLSFGESQSIKLSLNEVFN